MEFVDDTAIVSLSKDKMTHAINTLLTVTKQWALTISAPKTEAMVVSRTDSMLPELQFSSASVEMVSEFKNSVLHRIKFFISSQQHKYKQAQNNFFSAFSSSDRSCARSSSMPNWVKVLTWIDIQYARG